ncbi:hypothetical protein MUK42_36199, partial [Musa troglodytarum]
RKENGKGRKSEDLYAGKKIKDRKEKMIGCSSLVNMHYNQPDSESAYSVMMYDGNHVNQFSSKAFLVVDSRTKNLLEDNVKLLHQIAVNIENNEIQNNIDLLYHTNNNITATLNSMLEMPGIMSQMPPLPVYANENLLHSILPYISQPQIFSLSAVFSFDRHMDLATVMSRKSQAAGDLLLPNDRVSEREEGEEAISETRRLVEEFRW